MAGLRRSWFALAQPITLTGETFERHGYRDFPEAPSSIRLQNQGIGQREARPSKSKGTLCF
jgi:hypothetical protein